MNFPFWYPTTGQLNRFCNINSCIGQTAIHGTPNFTRRCACSFSTQRRIRDSCFTPRELFAGFSVRLISGTIGTDGLDPSGLYWIPKRPSHARQMVRMLTEFSAWSAREFGVAELNPLRDATKHEQVLAAAAWAHRNNASFLGHAESKARARLHFGFAPSVPLPRTLAIANPDDVVRFPEEHFPRLVVEGFSRRKCGNSPRRWMALRNILITLLMHGAGLRCSECFHLWVDDVRPDPLDPTRALVWVGHPSDGLAEWRDAAGKIVKGSRREYLRTRGLTPRNLIRGKEHAGWKGTRLDGKYYIQAHWSDASYARIFFHLEGISDADSTDRATTPVGVHSTGRRSIQDGELPSRL